MTMKPTILFVARQAGTQWHDKGQVIGRQDAELSMTGLSRAEKLAKLLSDRKIDVVYASRLGRAVDTAKAIAKYHKQRVIPEPQLDERGLGVLEGKKRKEIAKELKRLRAQDEEISEGESGWEFNKRVISFLENCLRTNEGKTVLIVTHEGPIEVIKNYFKRLDTSKGDDEEASLAGLSEFVVNDLEPLKVEIKALDNVDHLS